jgi:hypothetical protein
LYAYFISLSIPNYWFVLQLTRQTPAHVKAYLS